MAGSRRVPDKVSDADLRVYITKEERDRIDAIAAQEKRSRSYVASELLSAGLILFDRMGWHGLANTLNAALSEQTEDQSSVSVDFTAIEQEAIEETAEELGYDNAAHMLKMLALCAVTDETEAKKLLLLTPRALKQFKQLESEVEAQEQKPVKRARPKMGLV